MLHNGSKFRVRRVKICSKQRLSFSLRRSAHQSMPSQLLVQGDCDTYSRETTHMSTRE